MSFEKFPVFAKSAVVGTGTAPKEQVVKMGIHLLNLTEQPQAAADALAIAIFHHRHLSLPEALRAVKDLIVRAWSTCYVVLDEINTCRTSSRTSRTHGA